MPTTTRQLSKIADVSEQTVRNYTRDFGILLSPQARGDAGPRLFSDEDVQIFCSITNLRKQNVSPEEVVERLKRGDIVIDATPHQATPSPQTAQEGQDAALLLPAVLSTMQAQIDAIQRSQETVQRYYLLWGVLLGAIGALVLAGFVVWVLWLTGA